ncbi:MAG: hypothetical protein NE327_14725 [Lentisphaeraceae bacterium]|nr:hypothetical protein [Lentisphaeraceae bacterium]
MKFDDASWHYGGDYPNELPQENAATHIGIFLIWCIENQLTSKIHTLDKSKTPGKYCLENCDGKLTDEDFNDKGLQFAKYYYDEENFYFDDYNKALVNIDIPSLYHAEDTWKTYNLVRNVLNISFTKWSKSQLKENFQSLEEFIVRAAEKFSYKITKGGLTLYRNKSPYKFEITFNKNTSKSTLEITLNVTSREIKKWRESHGLSSNNSVLRSSYSNFFNSDVISIESNSSFSKIDEALSTLIEPFFSSFSNPEVITDDLANLKYPKWDYKSALEFLMSIKQFQKARKLAIKLFQKNIGQYYDYIGHFKTYRHDGLINYAGADFALVLARMSHVFEFGDLSKEVTPE